MSAPVAKASAIATSRRGGRQYAPRIPPASKGSDAPAANSRVLSTTTASPSG